MNSIGPMNFFRTIDTTDTTDTTIWKPGFNETGKITNFNTATRNKRSTMNFYGGSVEGIVTFDTRCATFTFYTFVLITSLYIVYNAYNAKLAFLNRSLCSLHDF